MSSILEALRELESHRAPAPDRATTPVLPAPSSAAQGIGFFMQAMAGLAVGALVFGGLLLAQRLVPSFAPRADVTTTPTDPGASDASPERPAWLDQAEPPHARVDRGSAEPARRSETGGPADRAREAPPETRPSRPTRQVELESIHYSGIVDQRSATLRVNGRRVTLGQRESAEGVEVQLITPDGVYLQRGADVFLVTPSR